MQDGKEVRGLICEARYYGSKFREWEGRDKQNPGRMKAFRNVTHRFHWETENGEEFLNTVEWVPDGSEAHSLADVQIPYVKGAAYKLTLRGLKEEGGVLQAETREITEL